MLQYSLGDKMKAKLTMSNTTESENDKNTGFFPHKGKVQEGLFPKNSSLKNENKSNEHLGKLNMDQAVEEINKEINE